MGQISPTFDFERYGVTQAVAYEFAASLESHITYVREAGRQLGVEEWQLEQHDLSKWSVLEFPAYARHFHGGGDPDGFAVAWLHHIHSNPHHWQHWIYPDGFTPKGSSVENGVVEMPEHCALEMLADWMGAGRAYTGSWDMTEWLTKNIPKIRVHSNTARFLKMHLVGLGYDQVVASYQFLGEAV